MSSIPKQESIFEEEEDLGQNELNGEMNNIFNLKSFSCLQPDMKDVQHRHEGSSEECLNIDLSKVKMVEYSPELMEKLKTDLSRNKFIPCTLNDDNVIVSYPLTKI